MSGYLEQKSSDALALSHIMAIKQSFHPLNYTDAEVVEGFLKNPVLQEYLYMKWSKYFRANYRAVFFEMDDDACQDLIHESYIVLWLKMQNGVVKVREGKVVGKDDKPFTAALTTYLMNVAKLKKKEHLRDGQEIVLIGELGITNPQLTEEKIMDIIANGSSVDWDDSTPDYQYEAMMEAISTISDRCRQILTSFYFQEMKLDAILSQLPSFQSKDALKTAKNKCLDKLRKTAMAIYESMVRFA